MIYISKISSNPCLRYTALVPAIFGAGKLDSSITLSNNLGTLDVGLGSFPLEHGASPPHSVYRGKLIGIRSLTEFGRMMSPPRPISSSTPN